MTALAGLLLAHAGHAPPQEDFPWWIVTVAVVAVLGLGLLFFLRRRS